MAIKIQSTNKSVNSVKALIYGESGVGKTKLAATAPTPLILNAEGGLLSLAGDNLDSVDITTVDDIMEIYQFLTESEDAKKYETIIIDSISEVAEVYLSALKEKHKDFILDVLKSTLETKKLTSPIFSIFDTNSEKVFDNI